MPDRCAVCQNGHALRLNCRSGNGRNRRFLPIRNGYKHFRCSLIYKTVSLVSAPQSSHRILLLPAGNPMLRQNPADHIRHISALDPGINTRSGTKDPADRFHRCLPGQSDNGSAFSRVSLRMPSYGFLQEIHLTYNSHNVWKDGLLPAHNGIPHYDTLETVPTELRRLKSEPEFLLPDGKPPFFSTFRPLSHPLMPARFPEDRGSQSRPSCFLPGRSDRSPSDSGHGFSDIHRIVPSVHL